MRRVRGGNGMLDAELEVRRIIVSSTGHVDNKGIIDGLW